MRKPRKKVKWSDGAKPSAHRGGHTVVNIVARTKEKVGERPYYATDTLTATEQNAIRAAGGLKEGVMFITRSPMARVNFATQVIKPPFDYLKDTTWQPENAIISAGTMAIFHKHVYVDEVNHAGAHINFKRSVFLVGGGLFIIPNLADLIPINAED